MNPSLPPSAPPKPLHLKAGGTLKGPLPIVDVGAVNSSLSITSAAKIQEGSESYVVYNIQVNLPDKIHTISRRYREFIEFHRKWSQQYKGIRHANLPPKKFFHTAKAIDTRRRQLEQYMRDVTMVAALRHEVAEFLEVDFEDLKKMVDLDKQKMGPLAATLPKPKKAAMGIDQSEMNPGFGTTKRYSTGGYVHIETGPSPVSVALPPPPARVQKEMPNHGFDGGGVWMRLYDAGEKDYYYYNNITGETTWEMPQIAAMSPIDIPPPPPPKPAQSMKAKIKKMGDMYSTRGPKKADPVSMKPLIKKMGDMFQSDSALTQPKQNKAVQRFSLRFKKPNTNGFKMKKSKTTGATGGAATYKPKKVNKQGSSDSPWRAARDPESGDVYYFHKTTGETSWDEPPGWIDSSALHRRPSVRVPDDFTVKDRIRHFNEL